MQDRFVGDIGDFGKYRLLRCPHRHPPQSPSHASRWEWCGTCRTRDLRDKSPATDSWLELSRTSPTSIAEWRSRPLQHALQNRRRKFSEVAGGHPAERHPREGSRGGCLRQRSSLCPPGTSGLNGRFRKDPDREAMSFSSAELRIHVWLPQVAQDTAHSGMFMQTRSSRFFRAGRLRVVYQHHARRCRGVAAETDLSPRCFGIASGLGHSTVQPLDSTTRLSSPMPFRDDTPAWIAVNATQNPVRRSLGTALHRVRAAARKASPQLSAATSRALHSGGARRRSSQRCAADASAPLRRAAAAALLASRDARRWWRCPGRRRCRD